MKPPQKWKADTLSLQSWATRAESSRVVVREKESNVSGRHKVGEREESCGEGLSRFV